MASMLSKNYEKYPSAVAVILLQDVHIRNFIETEYLSILYF